MRQDHEQWIAGAAKALSDPIRLRIIDILNQGRQEEYEAPACSNLPEAVCPEDLKLALGGMSSSKLSYHLKELKKEGFIYECREGKRIYYALVRDRFYKYIDSLRHLYEGPGEQAD